MGIGIFILLYTEPLAFVRIQRTMSTTGKSFNTYRNILHLLKKQSFLGFLPEISYVCISIRKGRP